MCLWWWYLKTASIHINLFDNSEQILSLTSSRGPKRKWTSSDALGFCMCFFSLACRGCSDTQWEGKTHHNEGRWELWNLTKRLRASFSFCRLSTNSASEGGLARKVSMPSVNKQCNNDHMQTVELPAFCTGTPQTGHRFHFLTKVQTHKHNVCHLHYGARPPSALK